MKKYSLNIEITEEMFSNSKEINSKDTSWMFPYIKNFIKNSSYNKFNPHITIGDGILERIVIEQQLILPIKFKALRLAICHLGNYCTCRKILYETELKI